MAISALATRFIDGVLHDIGAEINATTVQGFVDWLANEQGGPNLTAFDANAGNPLGVQTPEAQEAGKTGNIAAGIKATADLLKSSADYTEIVKAFREGKSTDAIATAVTNSPWNGNRYGGLQNFLSVAQGHGPVATGPGALNNEPQAGVGVGNAAQLSTSSSSGLTPAEAKEIDTPYTGPGAYKGFDLQGITAGQRANVEGAINAVLAQPGGLKGMLDAIYKNYGSEAWMANIPEVRTILVAGSQLGWDSNKALFDSEFQNTNWYKTTTTGARNYQELAADDPATAHTALLSAEARITNDANALGVQLTAAQLQSLGQTVVKQSISSVTGVNTYDETMIDDATIDQYIGAAAQTPAFAAGLTASQSSATASITGATVAPATTDATNAGPGGDAAYLYNQFTTIAKNYMLNWTPQQIAAAVQKAMLGDTGQGNFLQGQVAGFQTTAQNTAKALYPAFAGAVGTNTSSANDQDMYQATQSYRNIIAQFTGNADADSVDLNNPQWSWILSGGQPPQGSSATLAAAQGNKAATSGTNSPAAPPTIDQLQTYLMGTPQFQTTNMAKEMGWQVGSAITKAFGFN